VRGLDDMIGAIGFVPGDVQCVVENEIGSDALSWMHLLPDGRDEGWIALVSWRDDHDDTEAAIDRFERWRRALPRRRAAGLVELHRRAEVGAARLVLQRCAPGGSLAAALCTPYPVETRLERAVAPWLTWWHQIARPRASGERVPEDAAIPSFPFGWPAIPRFGAGDPARLQKGSAAAGVRFRGTFDSWDPLWCDLFDLREGIVHLLREDGERDAATATAWLDRRIDALFAALGADAPSRRASEDAAARRRVEHYYDLYGPDAVGRRAVGASLSS
jgi:hypothetical protein